MMKAKETVNVDLPLYAPCICANLCEEGATTLPNPMWQNFLIMKQGFAIMGKVIRREGLVCR